MKKSIPEFFFHICLSFSYTKKRPHKRDYCDHRNIYGQHADYNQDQFHLLSPLHISPIVYIIPLMISSCVTILAIPVTVATP